MMEGYEPSFGCSTQPLHHDKIDYEDDVHVFTTLPQSKTKNLERDGKTECMCTGWFKRMVFSTPGFTSPIEHPPKVAYEVRETEDRGLGVFATEDIEAGDLILAERPLLLKSNWSLVRCGEPISQKDMQKVEDADVQKGLKIVCSRMSPESLAMYESLPNRYQKDGSSDIAGIFRSNMRDVGVVDPHGENGPGGKKGVGRYGCVGALTSRFNHSCSPSAVYTFNMSSFSMEIHAVRPIAKGEEITVACIDIIPTVTERQTLLKQRGSTCTCSACKDPEVTDRKRKVAIEGLLPKTSQGIEHAEEVLAAFQAAGLQSQPRYIEVLQRVANIHRKMGSKERADELDSLAGKIAIAQKGRNYTPKSVEAEKPTVSQLVRMGSVEDMRQFILGHPDAVSRRNAMDELIEAMRRDGHGFFGMKPGEKRYLSPLFGF